ncbi:MAG: hypothetical protein M3R70_02570 [Actinomycetota bacterium]|nr:hypothetical protein [Actinomycetota bacterium]
MRAAVACVDALYTVDLDAEEVIGRDEDDSLEPAAALELGLPLVIATDAVGSTVVAVVDRRPPLAISHDAGRTWRESGGGLPRGRAVAVADDDPDTILYAGRNRIYLSTDGGRFWRSLAPELPEIRAVEWLGY